MGPLQPVGTASTGDQWSELSISLTKSSNLRSAQSWSRCAQSGLSGPIAILSLRYPYRAILVQGGWHSPKMVRYPPLNWYLVSHRHISAIPHFATYRAIIVRCPTKTSTKEFCDTIAASIARYAKYRYWASKSADIRKLGFAWNFTGNVTSLSFFLP